MEIDFRKNWIDIKQTFRKSFVSNLHFSVATVSENKPHVTPIGSVILGETGKGIFFEIFTRSFGSSGEKIQILAVNSSKWFWISSLIRGRFSASPGVRLNCILGERRRPHEDEIAKWQKRIGLFSWTSGYAKLWGTLNVCRDFTVESAETLDLGEMTNHLKF
jgi:hypothetical protein